MNEINVDLERVELSQTTIWQSKVRKQLWIADCYAPLTLQVQNLNREEA